MEEVEFEFGDKVKFQIYDGSNRWMIGTVYAVLRDGPTVIIIIMVGSNFYDANPKDVKKIEHEQI